MALVACPECQRQISTAAEACPQCGFPMRAALTQQSNNPVPEPVVSDTPKCYACSSGATTRCQSCGLLSCVQHVQSIFVEHGRGGSYELRCSSCYQSAEAWKIFMWVWVGIVLFVGLIVAFFVFPNLGKH